MNEYLEIYILIAMIVGLFNTVAYYRSTIRYVTGNATRAQIISALALAFIGSIVLAPLIILEFLIENLKRKEHTHE